jgi:hypothetical protein
MWLHPWDGYLPKIYVQHACAEYLFIKKTRLVSFKFNFPKNLTYKEQLWKVNNLLYIYNNNNSPMVRKINKF